MDPLFLETFFKECETKHKILGEHKLILLTEKQVVEAAELALERFPIAVWALPNEIYTRNPSVLFEALREAYSVWVDYYHLNNLQ